MASQRVHFVKRVALFVVVIALALACAILPAALRWELSRFSSGGLMEASTITTEGQRISLRVWPGGMWAKDALNLSISEASPASPAATTRDSATPLPSVNDGLPTLVPHQAWSRMIAESGPTSGDFVNLQAWGFPCRTLAGGFVNGSNRRVDWCGEYTVWGQSFTIPTRPIWSGIVINTAFYATLLFALLWLLCTLARRVAQWLAARRAGLCPHCRYDRSGLVQGAPCPECGTKPVLV